uniref:Smg4_UPF3 domain-containing protein n=1 Tax=Rhabditophanes sp. KR3021 TaxID=114890 RepID=A0AC35U1B4_9BILA
MTRKVRSKSNKNGVKVVKAVKVAIRHLPPSIKAEEVLGSFDPPLNSLYFQFYSGLDLDFCVAGHSAAIVILKSMDAAIEFAHANEGKVFKTSGGETSQATFELAPNEKCQKTGGFVKPKAELGLKMRQNAFYLEYFDQEKKSKGAPDFGKMLETIEANELRKAFGDIRETPLTREVGTIYLTKSERCGIRVPREIKERAVEKRRIAKKAEKIENMLEKESEEDGGDRKKGKRNRGDRKKKSQVGESGGIVSPSHEDVKKKEVLKKGFVIAKRTDVVGDNLQKNAGSETSIQVETTTSKKGNEKRRRKGKDKKDDNGTNQMEASAIKIQLPLIITNSGNSKEETPKEEKEKSAVKKRNRKPYMPGNAAKQLVKE